MKPFALSLIALLASLLPGSTSWAAEFPVKEGEDLLEALRRIRPCLQSDTAIITPEVMKRNPEHVDSKGKMVLQSSVLVMPDSLVKKGAECGIEALAEQKSAHEPATHEEAKEDSKACHAHSAESHGAIDRFIVSGLVNFTNLDGTLDGNPDLPLTLTSQPQLGAELTYEHIFPSRLGIGLSYRYLGTHYNERDDLVFVEPLTVLQEAFFHVIAEIGEGSRFDWSLGAAQIDELSFDPIGFTYVVDHTIRPVLGFTFAQEILSGRHLSLGGFIGGQVYFPMSSLQHFGLAEKLGLELELHLTHWVGLQLSQQASYEQQSTLAETHSALSLTSGVGLVFTF